MTRSEFTVARASCAYFFAGPGLAYGMLTARMPALKAQTEANEAEVGLILLCLGLSGMFSLAISSWLIARWSSRRVLRTSSFALLLSLPLCGLAHSPLLLGLACMVVGLSIGLVDVAMNTQGIQIERRYLSPCMSLMHASYSIGGLLGSLTGALFAGIGASPLINFLCILGLYACLRPLTVPRLQSDILYTGSTEKKKNSRAVPVLVLLCGILAMFTYAAEGSVAEWGSLLLFSVKGASEQTAALVFGAFSATTVLCRLFGDRLRGVVGDVPLMAGGTALSAAGMTVVLLSPLPGVCLLGYMAMGAGLSPIVPILFSRAGEHPDITPGKASAVVSFLAYSGMLIFPPSLGGIAHTIGLDRALISIPVLCVAIALGSLLFRQNVPLRKKA